MNGMAREVYKSALEEYTTSDMRSEVPVWIWRTIDYREGKYEDALKNHAFITNLYAESEIRPDADYVAGEIHFLRKNYKAAEQLLAEAQGRVDPSYLYAQYTLSIINVENKKMEAAVGNLKNIIADTTQDPATQLLQDAANMKLGHLYFEQVELRNAVEAYKRVPEGSSYGDEALLGTAWSWIKVNQPAVCLQTMDRLDRVAPGIAAGAGGVFAEGLRADASEEVRGCDRRAGEMPGADEEVTFVTEADLAGEGARV